MSGHATPIDKRPPAVLDLSKLTAKEVACLELYLRNARVDIIETELQHERLFAARDIVVLYSDITRLQLEVRAVYLRRMFE